MNATVIGKSLVFVNLALSFLAATFAFGLYTNRVDWPGPGPGASGATAAEKGENARLKAEVEEAQKTAGTAVALSDEMVTTFKHIEQAGPKRRLSQEENLSILEGRDKAGNPVNKPVQILAVETGKDGKPIVDEDGLPVVQSKPLNLLSRDGYRERLRKIDADILAETAALTDLLKKEQDRTVEINGLPGMQKGLRDLLAEENSTIQNARQELAHLRPLRYNAQVEAELLDKRQLALRARIEELRMLGMASR